MQLRFLGVEVQGVSKLSTFKKVTKMVSPFEKPTSSDEPDDTLRDGSRDRKVGWERER